MVFLSVSAITVTLEDILHKINIPVVSVIWRYTGLSVPEIEQHVTTCSPTLRQFKAGQVMHAALHMFRIAQVPCACEEA